VEGLLRIPSSGEKVPAFVLLPGATVPKEGTQGWLKFYQAWDMQPGYRAA